MAGLFSSSRWATSGAGAPDIAAHSKSLARWMQCTQAGNDAYDGRRWACSLGWHMQALWLAEGLCNGRALAGCPHECLASLVVSHHNLADVHWARGDTVAAISQWLSVRDALLPVLRNSDLPETVQQTVQRYLRVTQSVLAQWQQSQQQRACCPGACAGCPAALTEETEPADPVNPFLLPVAALKQ